MTNKVTDRIEVFLVQQNDGSKWLVEKLGMNDATASLRFTYNTRPSVDALTDIAKLLNRGYSRITFVN